MNNFIAACLVFPLLMAFTMQFGLQVKNNYNMTQFQAIVESAKEEAKQEGYFTTRVINKMKDDITSTYKGIDVSDITINVTTTPKYRINTYDDREMIEYEIGIPIEKIIAANRLWGIKDADNKTTYYLRGVIASEKLLPEEGAI